MNGEQFGKKLKENWSIFAVIGIFLLALKIRLLSLPLVKTYLPDIDTYLFYRLSDQLLNNNFHMIAWDTLRNYPFGLSTATEQPLPYYLPVIFYKIASIFSSLPYLSLVKYYSPIISSITIIPMYLIGKELKDKWTGIFSAFFLAVMPAILMRSPAGYIEKEPATLAFMMFSAYFFIRTLKKDSWLSAALMGAFLTLVDIGWGGVDHLYLSYAIFAGMILFVNNYSRALIKNYIFILIAISAGAFITHGSYFGAEHLMIYLIFIIIISRDAVEKYNIIKKESLAYFVPAVSLLGLVFVLAASTISPFFASFINQANGLLFYDEGIFGGTVAENQRPDFGSFQQQFGFTDQNARYTAYTLTSPKTETELANSTKYFQPLYYASAWILAFIALVHIAYQQKNKYRWLQVALTLIVIASFISFLSGPKSTLQIIFIVSMFASLFLFAKGEATPALMATFLFAAMLGFMSKVRIGFLIGPYAAIFAGYFISEAISRIMNLNAIKNAKTLEEKINIYSIGGGILIAIILLANLSAGYAVGSGMGPNYNDNWNNAMNFMKFNTSQDSVILSWWDFGYWFQAMSGRATMLDGGNNDIDGDKWAGRYFSSRLNETEQKEFLESRGITHLLVDASMIGKYSAMTRIGTDLQEIDQYAPLGTPQQLQKNGVPVLVFQLSPNAFYVSINPNGTTLETQIQQITFSTPRGDANLKYLCTENGLVDLKPKEPSMDGCLLFTKYGVFFPTTYFPQKGVSESNKLIGTSIFTKLFFFDGKGVDYVKKVYENDEVKIYEVELPRKTREELLNWWYENVNIYSMKDAFIETRLNQLKQLCVKGNDIKAC